MWRLFVVDQVEMFGVTADESGKESEQLLQELLEIQKHLFSGLGLFYRYSSYLFLAPEGLG